jgi:copper chaperone NosL
MKSLPRISMTLASIILVLVFLFPIWSITLIAPQYPSGITMYIWINQITGESTGTLQNINILNHYVGMQFIVPDSIPELKYFQFVIGALILLGLVAVFINKKGFYLAWVILVVILGILAVYDFYLWEYDYGHNLSPKAPIKVPGMAYQPPLFGKKMLLNFEAYSYPYWGSLFIGISLVFAFLAFLFRRKKSISL